jgi:UTP pyrophosphatase
MAAGWWQKRKSVLPASFVVHELAHLKEMEHNKAFYQLCEHMLPGYAQLEFDLRLFLTWRAQLPC